MARGEEALFLGGPWDGQRRWVSIHHDFWMVEESLNIMHRYRRVTGHAGLFVSEGLDLRAALAILVERHPRFEARDRKLIDWQAEIARGLPKQLAPIALQVAKPPVKHAAGACTDCDGKGVIGSLHGTTPCGCACHAS